ncbi:MAG: GNAT family N-acetyltransferase [Acidimicrobiales bacterium]
MNSPRGLKQPPGHLRSEPGLRPEDLRAIEDLAAACVAVDGGRLKLERGVLQSRPPDQVNDFLWMGDDGLVGFLGLYGDRPDQAEICGMVHPGARRQGAFTRLFAAATAELARRGVPQALLVVDRLYESGACFARRAGGTIEHSEHRMTLHREPADVVADPLVTLREAALGDARFVLSCISEAFGIPTEHLEDSQVEALARRFPGTLVIEYANEPVGTVRVDRDDQAAGIYGFAVVPRYQGRGIGRQVLATLARQLKAEGVADIGLEVSVTNDAALRLYLSCGFDVMGTEDYYEVRFEPRGTDPPDTSGR